MKCPHCNSQDDKVIESRSLNDGTSIRRRRECLSCGYRFTSYERIEEKQLMVIKSAGRREPFSREKLERGLRRAVEKRNFSQLQIESIVNDIEDRAIIVAKASHEIPTAEIGDMVLETLAKLDSVAYIRFASVYRNFENIEGFIQEISQLKE
ncbi:transcriptional regulator NrdR [Spirochaeta lutea]|uniref:Transcriptional repressor NrdR n=1 Tax=Spirochaeta lutea TaxID=1480694 RepID=A0A098QXS2_9SPIO|nr:transcriptional regulator NrdR [Spirochaeta lutea]KGE72238.1 transcriptional regulator NrdR [Spirochaeta lutea]